MREKSVIIRRALADLPLSQEELDWLSGYLKKEKEKNLRFSSIVFWASVVVFLIALWSAL